MSIGPVPLVIELSPVVSHWLLFDKLFFLFCVCGRFGKVEKKNVSRIGHK